MPAVASAQPSSSRGESADSRVQAPPLGAPTPAVCVTCGTPGLAEKWPDSTLVIGIRPKHPRQPENWCPTCLFRELSPRRATWVATRIVAWPFHGEKPRAGSATATFEGVPGRCAAPASVSELALVPCLGAAWRFSAARALAGSGDGGPRGAALRHKAGRVTRRPSHEPERTARTAYSPALYE